MKQTNTKKLAVAAVFCAVAVAGSLFSFPVFGSKCSPVQHMVNILCAVLLGPGYGLGAAFAAALIRNLLGLGSLMAFPGSMFGALISYKAQGAPPRPAACWRIPFSPFKVWFCYCFFCHLFRKHNDPKFFKSDDIKTGELVGGLRGSAQTSTL